MLLKRLLSRRRFSGAVLAPALASPFVCGHSHADDAQLAQAPGSEPSVKSKALEAGAALLQGDAPLDAMNMYLDGFHFYADDLGRQVEAHHFCAMLNEDVHQCVIFDGRDKNARLIGVEYIVSERLFRELPDDEKPLWHGHHYEVKSGLLVMPGIPARVEKEAMEKLVTTYGKTWHTWQIDRGDKLPLGIPQLMMGFTKDGQAKTDLIQQRDRRFDISTAERRDGRVDIPIPTVQPGANAWEAGQTVQLGVRSVPVRNKG